MLAVAACAAGDGRSVVQVTVGSARPLGVANIRVEASDLSRSPPRRARPVVSPVEEGAIPPAHRIALVLPADVPGPLALTLTALDARDDVIVRLDGTVATVRPGDTTDVVVDLLAEAPDGGGGGGHPVLSELHWTRVHPTPPPLPASGVALAWDSGRQVVVGHAAAVTVEWDGRDYRRRETADAPLLPAGVTQAAMAYDADRGVMVLFGGSYPGVNTCSDQTWELDGTDWKRRYSAYPRGESPPRRFDHRMVYDHARKRVVLFGGACEGAILSDTWEWDGVGWSRVATANSPSPREGFGMAWDPDRRITVLFGGRDPTALLGDTWEYGGHDWTRRAPAVSPPAGAPSIAW